MAKKIFDIIPPNLISDTAEKVKEIVGFQAKKKGSKSRGRDAKKDGQAKDKSRLGKIFIVSGIAFLAVAIYLYFSLALLSVSIWPQTVEMSYDELITASVDSLEIDLVNNQIPAQLITEEKELSREFDATGSGAQSGKATGTITVYNKISPTTPISLKTGTRFLSSSGRYFKAISKFTVPAAKTISGKLTPGSVDIKVEAMEAGDEYNIDADKFSIPGLVGTSSYYTVYGESKSKMAGGFKSTNKVVTADDIQGAKDALLEEVSDSIQDALAEESKADGLVFLEDVSTKEIEEASSTVKAGSEVDSFTYKVKVKTTALVFKESDMRNFVEQYMASNLTDGYSLLGKSLSVTYASSKTNSDNDEIDIDVNLFGKQYFRADLNSLALRLPGQTPEQIRETVNDAFSQNVSQLKIKLWPFWVKTCPKSQKKIKVNLFFE